jgi:membrane protein involved in colicin uptake
MKMTTLYAALSGAFLLGAAALVPAQTTPSAPAKAVTPDKMENKSTGISRDEYKVEKDRVEADAKAAKASCKTMKDNAKDICEAEAKGKEKLAKKELDYKKNPNEKNRADVEKMKAEVAYEVAKEKCEDLKGAEQSACKKTAKADKDKAVAAAKGSRKTVADSGTAARSGSTAGNTGGSATSSTSSTSMGSSTSPSPTTAGSATGATGAAATKSTQGTSGK